MSGEDPFGILYCIPLTGVPRLSNDRSSGLLFHGKSGVLRIYQYRIYLFLATLTEEQRPTKERPMAQTASKDRKWRQFKDRVKLRWDELSDSELDRLEGRFNLLSDLIQQRFDESHEVVQDFIDNLWFEIYVRGSRGLYESSH